MALESVNKIKSVAERDVDLLLLEEINVNPEFSAWFLSKSCPESHNSECVGAWHSVSDPELGESDLIILYKNGLAILVENKIDAPAQPRQGSRYQERGKKGIEEGNWKSFRTCMIAPKSYLLRSSGSQNYDSSISYEEIEEWISSNVTPVRRGHHKGLMFKEAIDQNRRGYTPETDQMVTQFWQDYWHFCDKHFPELEMSKPGNKPAGSDWPVFKPSFLIAKIPKTRIVHKLAEGFVDLELPQSAELSVDIQERLSGLKANVVQTGKSISIRIFSQPVDRASSFDQQKDKISSCLEAAVRLIQISNYIKE